MASLDGQAASRMIKRTGFSPWSSSSSSKAASRKAAAAAAVATAGPEPARILSDIAQSTENKAPVGPAHPGLSSHPKIMAVQATWEKQQQDDASSSRAGSANRESSLGSDASGRQTPQAGSAARRDFPSLRPTSTPHASSSTHSKSKKRSSPCTDEGAPRPSDSKRAHIDSKSTDAGLQVRENARRFTEDAVWKQMEKLNSDEARGQLESSEFSKPSMSFTSASDLVQKIRNANVLGPSQTPGTRTTESPKPLPTPPPKDGDEVTPLTYADEHRLYSQYPNPDGTIESARGALIPANYKHHNHLDYPAICPVRDCRRVFAGIKGLGGHFGAGHCSSTFNDNGDGTLTKIGSYTKHNLKGAPGIVISKNPLPPDAPPMADPSFPLQGAAYKRASGSSGRLEMPELRKQLIIQPNKTEGSQEPDGELLQYLHTHLSPQQTSFSRADIDFFLLQPRKRDLPTSWIICHTGAMLDMTHYACALAYLVGDKVTGKAACKAHLGEGIGPTKRLSEPCIALPKTADAQVRNSFSGVDCCVGCKYWMHLQKRNACMCDWFGQNRKIRQPDLPTKLHESLSSSSSSEAEESNDVPVAMDVDEQESEPSERTRRKRMRQMDREVMKERDEKRRRRKQQSTLPNGHQSDVGTPLGSSVQPAQLGLVDLAMEEWEVAPGRILDEGSSQNVAFSNSYLTSGQPITVSEDVSFNVLVIKPGSASHWNVEDTKLRTCSVAAGKVKVTMGDNVFQLGLNGMFVVRPGQTCKIENRLYADSVVHCTTIADFALR